MFINVNRKISEGIVMINKLQIKVMTNIIHNLCKLWFMDNKTLLETIYVYGIEACGV